MLFNPVSLFTAQYTVSYTEMEKLKLNERQDETLNKYIQHGKLLLSFTAHKTHKYIDRYEYIKSEKKNSDAENMMTKKYNTESHILHTTIRRYIVLNAIS